MEDKKPENLSWSVNKENIYTVFNFEDGSLFKRNNLRTSAIFKNNNNVRYFLKEENAWCPVVTIKKINGDELAVSLPDIHYKSKGRIIIERAEEYYWQWMEKSMGHLIILDNKMRKVVEIVLNGIAKGPRFIINYYSPFLSDKNKDVLLALGMFHFTPVLVSNEL